MASLSTQAREELVADTALAIAAGFSRYNKEFRRITCRARQRFEKREWQALQDDSVARIDLYEQSLQACATETTHLLGDHQRDPAIWAEIKSEFKRIIRQFPDSEFYKTFYSSLTRRTFATIGVNPNIEFIALDVRPTTHFAGKVQRNTYRNRGSLQFLLDELLSDYRFVAPYRNIERTVDYLNAEIGAFCESHGGNSQVEKIDLLQSVFYRGTRAYLVGKIQGTNWDSPLVIALKCSDDGVYADAVILTENDVSMLFGFTRSYFHVDLEPVGASVAFLKSIMPQKPIAEIYTVLGRAKQGKTERYRHFFQHLKHSNDLFLHAKGDKGMVMEVFTLPSYEVVFKLIRDKFGYPKTMSRSEVKEKYQLVFKHDRAGRLVDAQEFRRLEFAKDRFAPDLLQALLTGCSSICSLEDDKLVIDHLYIERRLTPLNLYLQQASAEDARAAVIDYGQAIRDLANSNIFAGDLLLKNFGVTRHGRVIFYDYDELCLLSECHFRALPQARDDFDEMRSGAWFYVSPNDIFPEQFVQFLGLTKVLQDVFMEHHAELLDADFWNNLKLSIKNGDIHEVVPYAPKSWSEHVRQGVWLSKAR